MDQDEINRYALSALIAQRDKLNAAIDELQSNVNGGRPKRRVGRPRGIEGEKPRKKMSAATRLKMQAAMKERWRRLKEAAGGQKVRDLSGKLAKPRKSRKIVRSGDPVLDAKRKRDREYQKGLRERKKAEAAGA